MSAGTPSSSCSNQPPTMTALTRAPSAIFHVPEDGEVRRERQHDGLIGPPHFHVTGRRCRRGAGRRPGRAGQRPRSRRSFLRRRLLRGVQRGLRSPWANWRPPRPVDTNADALLSPGRWRPDSPVRSSTAPPCGGIQGVRRVRGEGFASLRFRSFKEGGWRPDRRNEPHTGGNSVNCLGKYRSRGPPGAGRRQPA